jgi:hypothetical protein
MKKYEEIISELESFKRNVEFYYENAHNPHGADVKQTRERIVKQSHKIKKYLDDAHIITSVTGRAPPAAGGFPFHYDIINDIFSNERTPYAVPSELVFDVLNKAIGIYEDKLKSGELLDDGTQNTREGFFADGQYYDAQKFIRGLFGQSKKSIRIIDGYIDASVIDLLTGKPPEVVVEILTKETAKDVAVVGKAFAKQHGKLAIRQSDAFHDRFIILDNKIFYHLGASIKDLGRRTFMFSLLEEKEMIESLMKKIEREWQEGRVII